MSIQEFHKALESSTSELKLQKLCKMRLNDVQTLASGAGWAPWPEAQALVATADAPAL